MPVHNLPHQTTSFVGRSTERTEIAALLADPGCRLLTLYGGGGIGKTRLALQAAAAQLPYFTHGVCFVPLAPVTSPDQIAPTVASALEVISLSSEDVGVQITRYLREKHILLLLDNFEHLLDGVGLLTDILLAAPDVKLLVTSRERLNVRDEWSFALDGLTFPDDASAEPLEEFSAVQLFVQRVRQVQPNFSLRENAEAVKAICRRVEGMPLALELAASWLRAMPCAQVAPQIAKSIDFLTTSQRDYPERHRSLRAVFEQSWKLLSPAEQQVMARLTVFRGGFDLEAAQQVAGATLPLLAGLVDKSLVRLNAEGRYDLHELLRQFATEMLGAGETSAALQQHLDYFLSLAEQAEAHNFGHEQVLWFDRMESEFDNLRAAFARSLQSEAAETSLRLATALGWFFTERDHIPEGFIWMERALAVSDGASVFLRAKALQNAVRLVDKPPRKCAFCEQALALTLPANDRWNTAWAFSHMGIGELETDFDQAAATFDESLRLFRELGDPMGICHTLLRRCWAAAGKNDYPFMRAALEEALALSGTVGDHITTGWAFLNLGQLSQVQDHDLEQAKVYYDNALSAFRDGRFPIGVVHTITRLAPVERAIGNVARTQTLLRESLILWGQHWPELPLSDFVLAGLANAAIAHGQFKQAAMLLASVNVDPMVNFFVFFSELTYSFEQDIISVRTALGEDGFAEAWAAGKAMTRGQIIIYALEITASPVETKRPIAGQPLRDPLTPRELDVLRLIAEGLTNAEIAQKLFLTVGTVKVHTSNIYGKLGVSSRTQAVAQAQKMTLL